MDQFVVKLKRHASSYETGWAASKSFIDWCQNSRPTCPPAEEQPHASGATGSDDVSANPPSMYKINDIGNFVWRSLRERNRKALLLISWTASSYEFPVVHTDFQKFPIAMVGGV